MLTFFPFCKWESFSSECCMLVREIRTQALCARLFHFFGSDVSSRVLIPMQCQIEYTLISKLVHEIFSSTKHKGNCLPFEAVGVRLFYSAWDMCNIDDVRIGVTLNSSVISFLVKFHLLGWSIQNPKVWLSLLGRMKPYTGFNFPLSLSSPMGLSLVLDNPQHSTIIKKKIKIIDYDLELQLYISIIYSWF